VSEFTITPKKAVVGKAPVKKAAAKVAKAKG
jgi:hypothetical protein